MALLAEIALGELAVRIAATALVVILVALAVGWLGPVVGGTLAGLPIVIGPGFAFLLMRAPLPFVAEAAAYTVLALCATQIFALAYIVAASRTGPLPALAAATLGWAIAALAVRPLPPDPLLGLALFLAATLAARRIGGRFRLAVGPHVRLDEPWLLLVRGGLAGLLVAGVTVAAAALGAAWSGILLAFPIGLTVIAVTIHERLGRAAVIAILHSTMLGVASLAVFSACLAVLLSRLAALPSLLLALGLSLVTTLALTTRSLRQSP